MNKQEKQYKQRDIESLDSYALHINAMTVEGLASKSEIAAELAYRDKEIAELNQHIKMQNGCITDQHDEISKLQTKLSNYRLPE